MKRYITIALCALTVFGLGSCNKVHEEDFDNAGRSVTFQAQLGNDTRTGLALKFVPDWRETTLSDVHIWEVTGSDRIEGEDVKMRIPGEAEGNYEIALFKADFSNMTIIVNPPSNAPTRAGETYAYTSIVAPKDASGKFTVPSTQTPNSATLIDPHADFIVGKSPAAFDQSQAGKEVNLIFTRPVAISRLSIMNVEDAAIKQVKIYSSDKLTGSASYENVNFENATVSFDNSGSNVITLDYGSGVAMPAEGIFNAYFISLVGTKRITKIEVVTNAQTLTKEFEGGKALTFKVPDFKSIAVNMGDSVTPGPNQDQPQNIQFVRGTTVVTDDTYDLYSTADYVSPTVTGQADGATLTYSSSDEAVATVSSTGVVTPVGTGETTITVNASKVEGYKAGFAQFTLTVTDSTPAPEDQPLKFMKGGVEVTSDTYDLNNGGTYVSPTLDGAVQGATVTWAITCTPEGCATIDTDGKVTPVAVGAVVVTATASAVAPLYKQTSKSYDLQIKDSTPVVGPTVTINLEEATELVAGEKYVLVSNGFALVRDGENASAAAFDATAMTVTVPTDLQETLEWTLEQKSGSITRGNEYAFTQGAYFFGIAMNTNQTTYTYTVEVNNGREVSSGVSIQDHNISVANGLIYYAGNSSNYYVFYNTTDQKWDNEKVGNTASPAAASKTFLYKLKDMRADQNPTFSAATAEYDLYGPKWNVAVPRLQNAQGTVTYESSDTDVATVDRTSGAVTIMTTARSGDSVVITAKASGNDTYKPGEASYTINIVNTNPNVTKYVKVTSTADLEPGAKYLLVFEGLAGDEDDGDPKVFSAVLNSDGSQFLKNASAALDVTIANGVIESSDFDDCQFTLETGYYLKGDKANKYIYPGSSGSSSVMLAEGTASHALTITITSAGIAEIMYRSGNTSRYLVWSTYSHYFSCNTSVNNQGYSTGICLYKMDDGRQAQTLTFNAAEFQYDLATSTWTPAAPALSGAQTSPLTWESSNTAVATVNASGTVAPQGKGTATITVSAPASTQYRSATASYELTVVDSTPGATTTYTKVSSTSGIVAGKQYLVVYENGATSKVFKPILSGSTYTASADNAIDAVVSNGTIESGALEDCLVTLEATGSNFFMKAAGSYLYPSQSNIGAESSPTSSRALSITISNGKVTIKRSEYSHYLGFETYFLRTGSDTGNLALYTVSDGTTPEPPTPVAQNLIFNPTSVSGKVGETVTKPTLTGAFTTVTYSSSNTAVVEVNSDGDLTLKSQGSATITAVAEAGTVGGVTYAEGTATYTVNVSPADTPSTDGKTYTKINGAAELVTGTYVIVEKTDTYVYNASGDNHGGYGTIGTTAGISKSGSTITLSNSIASSYEFTFTRTGNNLTIQPVAGEFAGKYMYATNTVSNTYIDFKSEATNFVVNVQANTNYVYFATPKTSSDYTEYLYKKSSDNFFKLGGSGSPTAQDPKDAGIYLYKLDDGGTTPVTPDPPTPTTPTYSLITPSEFVSGGTYLIVSADSGNYNNADKKKAFAGDADGSVVTVDGTSGTITGDFSACEFVITESGGNYTLKIGSNYVTGNQSSGSRYIQVSTSAVTMSLASASELGSGEGLVSDAFYFYYTKGSGSSASKEVLYLNTDGKYKIGQTGRKYGTYLFKKN